MTDLPRPPRGPVEVALARAIEAIPSPAAMPGGSMYELKRDGFRVVAVRHDSHTTLWSRRGPT